MSESIEARAASWCQPISSDAFCGALSRYEADYERMQAEIGRLDTVYDPPCDWVAVQRCADSLLREKTKDMNVLGPLCVALLQQEGVAGLAAGLWAYRELIAGHSGEMFPDAKRRRGRAGAYAWLTQRLIADLETRQANPSHHAALQTCLEQFDQLDALLREQLADEHPAVGSLKRQLADLIAQSAPPPPAPEPAPAPEPTPAPESSATPELAAPPPAAEPALQPAITAQAQATPEPPPPAPSLPKSLDNIEEAKTALERVAGTLKQVALFHLRHDKRKAIGYQLACISSALEVVPDGDRAIGAPSPRLMRELQQALHAEKYADGVALAPQLLEEDGFSPEVQCLLARAIAEMGSQYHAPLATLVGAALGFHRQMETLAGLSSESVEWLRSQLPWEATSASAATAEAGAGLAAEPASSQESTSSEQTGEPSARIDTLVAEAAAAAKKKGLQAGCRVLKAGLDGSGVQSVRFFLRLAMAELCVEHRAPEVARPILQDLLGELQQPIAQWRSELVARVAHALLASNRLLEPSSASEDVVELKRESAKMMTLLSQVDPEAACRAR